MKVLLLKMKQLDRWALPGGFIRTNEDVDQSAARVLQERTGLDDIFLQQVHLFGESGRNKGFADELVENGVIAEDDKSFFERRFISMAYYALVEYSRVNPRPDKISDSCEWFGLEELPHLILDHDKIIRRALISLRRQLSYQPIGKNLLPEKFSMPELQALYETLLGQRLDRRNFRRKMLGCGMLIRLNERRRGGAHKSPYLYVFDEEKYAEALKTGFAQAW
jgi:ADP-ribose pyrophosphatase YjhB (NUDIX family)